MFRIFDLGNNYKSYEVKKIEKFDKKIDVFTESIKNMFRYSMSRDYKFLNWRYATNNIKYYEKRLLVRDKKISGYCIFRCCKFNNIKNGIILDIFSEDSEGFNTLLNEIIRYFLNKKMKFVSCYMINNSFFYKTLLKRGFIPLPKFLLPKKNAFVLLNGTEEMYNLKNWYVSYGDWDCV